MPDGIRWTVQLKDEQTSINSPTDTDTHPMGLKELYTDVMDKHGEAVRYIFFGGLTTVFSWLTYALFVRCGLEINLSNILSWVCGVCFAFVVNKWFVFESKSLAPLTVIRELGSFFAARVFTGIIAIVLFPILYSLGLNQSIFGTDGFLAKIITSVLEIILNWVFSKYLIFIKKKG